MGWGVHDYPGPPPERRLPICPVCGWDIDIRYGHVVLNKNGEVIGCSNCLDIIDAETYNEEYAC